MQKCCNKQQNISDLNNSKCQILSTHGVIFETEFQFDTETIVTMTIFENNYNNSMCNDMDVENKNNFMNCNTSRKVSSTNLLRNIRTLSIETSRKNNLDSVDSKSVKKVRFGGEVIKLRTPESTETSTTLSSTETLENFENSSNSSSNSNSSMITDSLLLADNNPSFLILSEPSKPITNDVKTKIPLEFVQSLPKVFQKIDDDLVNIEDNNYHKSNNNSTDYIEDIVRNTTKLKNNIKMNSSDGAILDSINKLKSDCWKTVDQGIIEVSQKIRNNFNEVAAFMYLISPQLKIHMNGPRSHIVRKACECVKNMFEYGHPEHLNREIEELFPTLLKKLVGSSKCIQNIAKDIVMLLPKRTNMTKISNLVLVHGFDNVHKDARITLSAAFLEFLKSIGTTEFYRKKIESQSKFLHVICLFSVDRSAETRKNGRETLKILKSDPHFYSVFKIGEIPEHLFYECHQIIHRL